MRKSTCSCSSPYKSSQPVNSVSSSSLSTLADENTLIGDQNSSTSPETDLEARMPKRNLRREFQSEILGSASAKRLNVSLPEETSRKVSFQRENKPNGDKVLTEEDSQSDEEKGLKGCQHQQKAKEASVSGMKKWKHAKHDSFVVDMSKDKNAEVEKTDQVEQISGTNPPSTSTTGVYYPAKSPLRRQIEGQKPHEGSGGFLRNRNRITIGIMVFLLVATILYFLLLGKLYELEGLASRIISELEELNANLASLSNNTASHNEY